MMNYLKKDEYKKQFAEENGYELIEIWYDEIEDGTFKQKIETLVTVPGVK